MNAVWSLLKCLALHTEKNIGADLATVICMDWHLLLRVEESLVRFDPWREREGETCTAAAPFANIGSDVTDTQPDMSKVQRTLAEVTVIFGADNRWTEIANSLSRWVSNASLRDKRISKVLKLKQLGNWKAKSVSICCSLDIFWIFLYLCQKL